VSAAGGIAGGIAQFLWALVIIAIVYRVFSGNKQPKGPPQDTHPGFRQFRRDYGDHHHKQHPHHHHK
jgi:hypothetical protein